MKKLNALMIISDFDGTLADSSNGVSGEVVDAINAYVSAGGIFAVCTGRMMASILPRVRELGLKGLVVASQGSQIADIESGELIRDVGFTPSEGAEACRALEELAGNVNIYSGDDLYTSVPEDDVHLVQYENIIGVKAKHAPIPLSEFVALNKIRCQKAACMCRASMRDEIYQGLLERFGDRFDVTCSAAVLVEVSPYGETKGRALEFLADYYGVAIEKTVAVGDNLNDLSMIKRAGVGVAVGNAEQGLKEQADFISVTNDELAVKQVIEKFGYAND